MEMQKGFGPAGALWFLNTRVVIRLSYSDGTDGISILEHYAPFGDSPPLHLHGTEDEVFHILDGTFRFKVADDERVAAAGDILLAPKNVPHTYCIESSSGGRWLTVTRHQDFERFVRALGRPAEGSGLPKPAGPPSPQEMEVLTATARQYGIELVGPPLLPPSSRVPESNPD